MNKWTIILLFLAIVGGGIYLIPKIDITKTVQYEKIEKKECGHYNVTSLTGKIYHGYVKQINKEEKTAVVKSMGFYFIEISIWAVLIIFMILQFIVWSAHRKYGFDTDFFQAWWECSHRPVSEESKQAFRNFFGYQQ